MSKASYELWYLDDIGIRRTYIGDGAGFEDTKVLGDVGIASVSFPKHGQVYDNQLVDRRIAIYRRSEGRNLSLDFVMVARQFGTRTSNQGQSQLTISGTDFNGFLARRIVAYYAESAQAEMTDQADDMMKEVVRDNFIDNADYSGTPSPARDIDSYGLSVAGNLAAGPSLARGFAWRNVLGTLQDIQAASKTAGTEVFFGIIPTSETTMQFRTWTAGRDRTVSGSNPIVFSLEWGNLSSPQLTYDYSQSANYVYAGGKGQTTARNIQTAGDSSQYNLSRLARVEAFVNATNADLLDDDAVTAAAQDELTRRRAIVKFTGAIYATPLTPYGGIQGWNLGDTVTVNYAGVQLDVLIRAVNVKVTENDEEIINARVEAVG
jgi:hypothetical protein